MAAGALALAATAAVGAPVAGPCARCHPATVEAHPWASLDAHASKGCLPCHGSGERKRTAGADPHAALVPRAGIESTCAGCHRAGVPGDHRVAEAGPFSRRTGAPRHVRGEVLYRELVCGWCHGGERPDVPSTARLARTLGSGRLEAWSARSDLRARGPRCPAPALDAASALAIESALGARWEPAGSASGSAERGETVVAKARCVTCHAMSGRGGRLAADLALAGSLWREDALATWNEHAPGCPTFRLSAADRADVAAYLASALRPPRVPGPPPTSANPAACLECHGGERLLPITAQPWSSLVASLERHGGLAGSALATEEREALAVYLSSAPSAPHVAPAGSAELAAAAPGIDCFSCHRRGAAGGDVAPDLGSVGRRLRRDWLVAFLKEPDVVRPHVVERMPRFGLTAAEAEAIAGVLLSWSKPGPSPALGSVARGARLYEERGCASCHARAGKGGALAPALDRVRDRLQPEFVVAVIDDPQALVPESLMPDVASREEAADIAAFLLEPRP